MTVVADPNLRGPALSPRISTRMPSPGLRRRVDIAIGDPERSCPSFAGAPAPQAESALLDQGAQLVITKHGPDR